MPLLNKKSSCKDWQYSNEFSFNFSYNELLNLKDESSEMKISQRFQYEKEKEKILLLYESLKEGI